MSSAAPAAADVPSRARTARLRAAAASFIGFGAYVGAVTGAAPAVQSKFELTDGELGVFYTVPLFGALLSMWLSPRVLHRFGPIASARACMLALAIATAGMGWTSNLALVVFLYCGIAGMATGVQEVAANAAAVRVAAEYTAPVLGWLHGAFNFGAVVAVLVVSTLFDAGHSLGVILSAGGALVVLATLFTLGAREGKGLDEEEELGAPIPKWLRPKLTTLAALGTAEQLVQGVSTTWSVVYAVAALGASSVVGGALFIAFQVAMVAGRGLYAPIARRIPSARIGILCGLGLTIATVIGLGTTSTWLAAVGFFLSGLAIACLSPSVMQVVGDVAPNHIARSTSIIWRASYVGCFGGPLLVGQLSDISSLRLALGGTLAVTGVVVAMMSMLLSRQLASKTGQSGSRSGLSA